MIPLEHTIEEVNLILTALQELPHKFVEALINKIKVQATPQVPPPVEAVDVEVVE